MSTNTSRREVEFTLPIGYMDNEGNTHRQAVLRKMTGKEEAILADRRHHRNGGRLVSELLHSCLVRLGNLAKNGVGTVEEMYSADRNFLLLKLRTITFGSELQASYTCPSCNESFRMVEDLDELPVRMLGDDETIEDVVVDLQDGYVDKDGAEHRSLRMRLPTGADESAVAPQMRQNASLGKNALLSRCLKTLGDLPKHRLEAIGPKILSELTLTDRRLIDRALNQAAPGVDLIREIACPHCGNEFRSSLDMTNFLSQE